MAAQEAQSDANSLVASYLAERGIDKVTDPGTLLAVAEMLRG